MYRSNTVDVLRIVHSDPLSIVAALRKFHFWLSARAAFASSRLTWLAGRALAHRSGPWTSVQAVLWA